jgi:myo-inositol-1(or 4)-monophosphatase
MDSSNLSDMLRLLYRAATAAAELLVAQYNFGSQGAGKEPGEATLGAYEKDPLDPRTVVSKADFSSEEAIMAVLNRQLDCRFLSEEAGDLSIRSGAEYRIVMDPLDGSRNYVDGVLGLFGLSIGVERGNELVAGAVHLPWFGELLLAEKNEGVFLIRTGIKGQSEIAHVDAIWPALRQVQLHDARIVIGRGSADASVLGRPPLSSLAASCGESLNYASCSVGLACVALERIDGLVLPRQKYWDFAAGYRIVQESAGYVQVWQDDWSQPVDETALTRATGSDYFDIVATRSQSLLEQITSVLQGSHGL